MNKMLKSLFAIITALAFALGALLTTSVAANAYPVTGTFKPDSTNVGVPPGTVLTKLGDPAKPLIITVDNTVIDSKDIYGDIKVQAKNVTIKNSRIHCGNYAPSGASGCIDANSAKVFGLKIFNNTINPDRPHYFRDGVVGHEYHAARNWIQRTTDGFGVFNKPGGARAANVLIEANYVHNLTYWKNDAGIHADGTHNDGIQVQGGENIRIWGNNINNTGWAAAGTDPAKPGAPAPYGHGCGILTQNNTGVALKNVVVERNWVDSGIASICVQPGTITLQYNRLGVKQWPYKNSATGQRYVIRLTSESKSIAIGLYTNVFDDTGIAVKKGRDAGTTRAGVWFNGP